MRRCFEFRWEAEHSAECNEVEPKPTQQIQVGIVAAVGEHVVESGAFGWDYADDDRPASEELQ